jgi:hypothetical protein
VSLPQRWFKRRASFLSSGAAARLVAGGSSINAASGLPERLDFAAIYMEEALNRFKGLRSPINGVCGGINLIKATPIPRHQHARAEGRPEMNPTRQHE